MQLWYHEICLSKIFDEKEDIMEKIKELWKKYEEIIRYIIVGGMTTVVSWGTYAVCKFFMDVDNAFWMQVAVIMRWVAGVAFAYVTNRIFVFKSKNGSVLKEIVKFTSSRVVTLFMDMFIMWLLPGVLGMNDWISTFISAVLVTVTNYIFSKFLVFRKKK